MVSRVLRVDVCHHFELEFARLRNDRLACKETVKTRGHVTNHPVIGLLLQLLALSRVYLVDHGRKFLFFELVLGKERKQVAADRVPVQVQLLHDVANKLDAKRREHVHASISQISAHLDIIASENKNDVVNSQM